MVLQINNEENDTFLGQLGILLYNKLNDDEWEIKDSALEVLTLVTELARDSKYLKQK